MKKIFCSFLLLTICFIFIFSSGCRKSEIKTLKLYIGDENGDYFSDISNRFQKKSGIKTELCDDINTADLFVFRPDSDIKSHSEKCYDLSEIKTRDNFYYKELSLRNGKIIYATPLKTGGYIMVCNRKYVKNPEYITDFESLKTVAEELQKKSDSLNLENVFSPLFNDENFANDLLSIPIYAEFEENDDYDFPLLAASAAKKIAFRYSEEAETFLKFYMYYSGEPLKKDDCYRLFFEGKTALAIISTQDYKLFPTDADFSVIPISPDGFGKATVLAKAENYIGINKNSSKEKITDAEKFIEFLYSDSEFRIHFDSIATLFGEKNIARIFSGDNVKIIPVLTGVYPDNFSESAGKSVLEYLSGNTDWLSVENTLKTKWERSENN